MKKNESPMKDDPGQVACGTYLDRAVYEKICEWCGAREIAIDKFIRVATYHFFYTLSVDPDEKLKRLDSRYREGSPGRHAWGGH